MSERAGRSERDIAIVGMACRFPQAPDLGAFWANIRAARVCFSDVPRERWNHELFYHPAPREPDKSYARKVGFIDDIWSFPALHYGLPPLRVKVTDPQHRLLLDAVRGALADAGYERRPYPRATTGVFVGASVAEHKDLQVSRLRALQMADGQFGRPVADVADSVEDVTPIRAFSIAGNLLNMMAATVAQQFDLGGPAFAIDAACSSALVAAYEAIAYLRAGTVDMAIAGGVYVNLAPDNLVGFSRIGAISRSDACRPFDADADGFVLGEGVGAVILKRLDDAVRDGDRIYAVVRGAGINNDGRGEGPMTPRAEGQVDVLARAYRDAGVTPDTIGFIEAHGTATGVGDVVEVSALTDYFGAHAAGPVAAVLSSVKANIGHTMSAAGIAGLIKAALVLWERTIPPQAAFAKLHPALDLRGMFTVTTEERPWPAPADRPRRAAVSSFGFGGTNCHLVLEEAPETAAITDAPQAFVISAPTPALLDRHLAELREAISVGLASRAFLAEIAATLAARRREAAAVGFAARSRAELLARLEDARRVVAGTPVKGVWFRPAPESHKVAFLFPGQGAQAVGLCRALYERFPQFRARLEAHAGELLAYLYPPPPFDHEAAARALMRTEICQPIMAALGMALADFVVELGVRPDVVLGHSLGEIAAAGHAGLLAPEDAMRLVAERGRIIRDLPLADAGAMAAIAAERHAIEPHLPAGVVLANYNHPGQIVASGTTAGVTALIARLAEHGISATRLAVSHAFHSPLMAGATAPLRALVAGLEVRRPAVPVISCIDPGPYPAEPEAVRELLVRHATAPVSFVGGVTAAADAGATVLVQMGSGSALLAMARATLKGRAPAALVAVAALEGDDTTRLAEALAELAVLGLPVDLLPLVEPARGTWLPPAPLETERYCVIERKTEERMDRHNRANRGPAAPADTGPASPPAGAAPVNEALVALFREQMAVLQAQTEIIRRQTEAIAGVGAGVPASLPVSGSVPGWVPASAPGAVPASAAGAVPASAAAPSPSPDRRANPPSTVTPSPSPSPVPNPPSASPPAPAAALAAPPAAVGVGGAIPRGSDSPALESRLLDVVAAVSAFPRGSLDLDKRLSADLGFDSLMVVELAGKLAEIFPGLGTLPKALFVNDPPLRKLAAHVARTVDGGAAPLEAAPVGAVTRYLPTPAPLPLPAAPPGVAADFAPVTILADGAGVAAELERLLGPTGIGPALVDLRALDAPASALRATTIAAFQAVRDARPRPAAVLLAHRGPAGAALPGLAKALAREWPEAHVKSVAFAGDEAPAAIARALAAELRTTDATVEVVYRDGVRHAVALEPAPRAVAVGLRPGAVVVIAGGTRGLGAKLALELTQRAGARVALLGRTPPERPPTGASFHRCDVTDAAQVAAAVAEARRAHGPIEVVVHAAGVLADGAVERKTDADFGRVLDTKVAGALALWDATAADPVRAFLLFSSWAGRFGNAAQTDYAAASAALAGLATALQRSGVRVVALDLPPWEGTAMVASIPAPLRAAMRAEGVTFLDDAAGLDLLVRELEIAGPSGEVLLGADLPALERRDVARFRLSVAAHPYLDHHRIDGRPVLPLAAAASYALDGARRVAAGPVAVRDLELDGGVVLPADGSERLLTVRSANGRTTTVELATADGIAYRAAAAPLDGPLPALAAPAASETPPIPLDEFYARHTFHGPRLRGIVSVDGLSATHVAGVVRSARAGELPPFTIDPLFLDSCFQLAGYWAIARHGRAGLPLGVGELRLLAPVPAGAELSCLLVFDQRDGDLFSGNIDCRAADGSLVLQLRGVRAELRAVAPQIAPEHYRIEEIPAYKELRQKLDLAQAMGMGNPYFNAHEGITADTSIIAGREVLNFSSYNYLGLSGDPEVSAAVKAAVDRYGTSVSASRVASGEKPLHRELEGALARFLGTEDAIVMVGGHATNVGVIGHLFGPGDLIVHDSLAHDSIMGGAKLSGARRRPFPHSDPAALDALLGKVRREFKKVLIAVEGTYSMDGDIPPLDELVRIKKKHKAMMLVDEAHSFGVVGATGRGVGEHFGVDRRDVELWMGTLSKSLASCGGYIAGSRAAVEYLKYTTPAFVYSVGISPPNAASALAALRKLEAHPELVATLRQRARFFLDLCRRRGVDTGMSEGTAVIPCIVGNSWDCLQLAQALGQRGVNVQPILYPAVEEHLARLRFFISAKHSEAQLTHTADVLTEELYKLNPSYLHRRRPLLQAGS